MKDSKEIKAEMQNKIQALLLVSSDLHKGKDVPQKLIEAALKDIEELKGIIEKV